jgi:hypothetical protein
MHQLILSGYLIPPLLNPTFITIHGPSDHPPAQLVGLLDGSDAAPPQEIAPTAAEESADDQAKPMLNPAYTAWLARDQSVLSYLLQSLSMEILPHVHRIEHTAGIWKALEEMFAAQSEARNINLLVAPANTKKLRMTTSEFLTKMQSFSDELVSAGHPLPDRQLVSYILAGLGGGYNSLVAALGVSTTPITLSMMYSRLHAYDQRQEMLNASPSKEFEMSANMWRSHLLRCQSLCVSVLVSGSIASTHSTRYNTKK